MRAGSRDSEDIRSLDEYRRSFREAYEAVSSVLESIGWAATGRPAKTTTAIVEKLNRQNIRLTQIQDIAGFRLLVPDISEQNRIIEQLGSTFRKAIIVDRRVRSSHGYRAVHVVVSIHDKPIEIQVRTRAQHLWAEISEKLSDSVDPAVKYGGGPQETRDKLTVYSDVVQSIENAELELIAWRREHAQFERELDVVPATDPDHRRLGRLVEDRRKLILQRENVERRSKEELISLLEEAYNEIGRGES